MSSPSKPAAPAPAATSPAAASPTAWLPSGRARWIWLAVAGALGLWLLILLAMSGPSDSAAKRERPKMKSFDTPAVDAFSKRPPVKSTRPSAPFPVPPDQGQSK
ncbi:MAG TPA: hypothetical protein VMG12_31080 [Polyangiaceae bacterium]|nr:hypothetical protein [Polyangiaceae bacterium]